MRAPRTSADPPQAAPPNGGDPAPLGGQGWSLRRQLLVGIVVPVILLMSLNALSLYRQALQSVTVAYDRTLLASAKAIGELLEVEGEGPDARFRANTPYSALEAFEADTRSRMFYRVSDSQGRLVEGHEDLAAWRGRIPDQGPYAALVDFYDTTHRGDPVRVAVLLQPVAGPAGRGVATIQVAETLELRRTLARHILLDTLWRQALLAAVIVLVVVLVVQRATRPVRGLSAMIRARPDGDLTPIAASMLPRELLPVVDATNQVMERLQRMLDHRKRFVRDASHQLRTPLAVLKTQVQSALRSDVAPMQALHEISSTVDRATTLANQMLALAKVEQMRQQPGAQQVDLADAARAVALDLAPLMAERDLDFGIDTAAAPVRAHAWMLRELVRNLLHNAIRHAPARSRLSMSVQRQGDQALLTVSDEGPGIAGELRSRLFQPFAAGDPGSGSGLGLAICQEIVRAQGGTIALDNRVRDGRVQGLDARVLLPLATAGAA